MQLIMFDTKMWPHTFNSQKPGNYIVFINVARRTRTKDRQVSSFYKVAHAGPKCHSVWD